MPKTNEIKRPTRSAAADLPGERSPLKWTAQEYAPRHRWWWYLIVGVAGLYITSFLFLDDQWGAAALAFVITFALIVFAADKPRSWHYELDGRTLTVEGETRVRPIVLTWDLDDYQAVTREQIVLGKGESPYELLVLIGRRRLSWPRDVYLTRNSVADKRILARLIEVVPFDQAPQFQAAARILQWLGRFIRIA